MAKGLMTNRNLDRPGRRFAPACEVVERRELLSMVIPTYSAPAPSSVVTGGLDPGSDSGVAKGIGLTNFRQPTFAGLAPAYAVVQLFGQRLGDSGPIPLGQTVADDNGRWALTAGPLVDGAYRVTVSETAPGGFPTPPVNLVPANGFAPFTLIVDTAGPRVAELAFDPAARRITVVFQAPGSLFNLDSIQHSAHYTLVRANDPRQVRALSLATSPAVSGFYTGAVAEVLTIQGGPLRPGRYTFQVASGGVTDLAGNALDGEFRGTFPTGDGRPGGNFLATLTVPRALPAGHRARRR